MKLFGAIFALLCAAAGWHYLFYSSAAGRLAGVEDPAINARRVRLRRANGLVMIVLGILICAGFYSVDPQRSPSAFVAVWSGVMLAVIVITALALIDIRLTARLRRKR